MYFTANTGASQSDYNIWALDIKGEGDDPIVPDADNISLIDRYIVYKIFEDVDGLNNQLQTDLLNLSENLIFKTIEGTLAVFDDGLEKVSTPYVDPKDIGLPVNIKGKEEEEEPPLGLETSESFLIYPVPTRDGILKIQNKFDDKVAISITNLSGKEVLNAVLDPGESNVNIDFVDDGIYLVKVHHNSDRFIYRIIKR